MQGEFDETDDDTPTIEDAGAESNIPGGDERSFEGHNGTREVAAPTPPPPQVVSPWNCSICGEPSRDICVYCTKDTCANHICERCLRCSDCCACDMARVA